MSYLLNKDMKTLKASKVFFVGSNSQIDVFYEQKKAFCLKLLSLTMFPKGKTRQNVLHNNINKLKKKTTRYIVFNSSFGFWVYMSS
jgi:hypothetical protein